ncbi:Teichuronic acid biosynthesis protein TuaB [Poriferisphaera corsica]|uniref:Teichuronic acid biosynthesis protein TuaB n=1 Tax=Poriferisphaera corsica TaxID=2528020 RepID=A0A517YWE1_9BACT|nr:oligosaccharide flippase family protein [Poriferisphaera corsica]QDU34546.1 Teichuronic acid biosynthesis protein TuaB [Poriferisphaera corsica]
MSDEATANEERDDRSEGASSGRQRISLKQRAIQSTAIVTMSFGMAQMIRLASNLILTRLLAREVFGIMLLVQTVVVAANLFSDMGIGQNIINHKRGAEQSFMNTVWTTGIIRGFILWLIIAVLAYPMAVFWKAPEMAPMIIVVGFSYVIMSFESTGMWLLCREVKNLRVEIWNVLTQIISTVLLVWLAFYWRSVWVLVIASLIQASIKVVLSYLLLPGHRCWFTLEREGVRDILHYGWPIFISTGTMFVLRYSDKVILGRITTKEELGIYSIAFALASMIVLAINHLANNTLFPVYSRLAEQGSDHLRKNTFRIRAGLLALALPGIWAIAIFGDKIIELLYRPEYYAGGWMLRLMAVASIATIINQTSTGILLAIRNSKRYMVMQGIRAVIFLVAILIGAWYGGLYGLLVGAIVASLSEYPVIAWAIRPHKVWLPVLDFGALGLSGVVIFWGSMIFQS